MTDKLREAAQQALTWFECFHKGSSIDSPASSIQCSNALRAALAQQDAQAVPQGWKLVPVEPTEAMCEEGLEDEGHTIRDGKAFADALYRAMLNAAPTPPAQRVLLTPDEIEDLARGKSNHIDFAHAVIEAYERKNAQPNAETVDAMQEARQMAARNNKG